MASPQIHHPPHRLVSPPIQRVLLAVILIAVTLVVYAPVTQHPFITIDDYGYVVNNFHIQYLNWDMVKWSLTSFHYSNWDPLTWLSHALDWHFFGRDAGRHHRTSMLLHALSAVLLFWMLAQATGYVGRSFAAAALFALHPVNVEAVAWVAERKTVLSMVFFLLTLIAYRWYARRPAVVAVPNQRRVRVDWSGVLRYLVVAMLFACALMSKPQAITLPFVLLLWDYWPLGRLFASQDQWVPSSTPAQPTTISDSADTGRAALQRRVDDAARAGVLDSAAVGGGIQNPSREMHLDASLKARSTWMQEYRQRLGSVQNLPWLLLEKLPLLALSAGSAFLTMKAQWVNHTTGGLNKYPFSIRLSGSIVGYVQYLRNAFWPTKLSFFYPHAHSAPPLWQVAGTSLLLLAITGFALANGTHRYLAVGWFWFLGTLVPMIQLVQVGNHAMADRYAYVPFVGLFIAICWGVADVAEGWRSSADLPQAQSSGLPGWRIWLPAGTIAILVLLALLTRRQLSYWTDDLTLWRHSAQAVENNAMAENMIGETLLQRRDTEDAIVHFRAAAAMDPLFPFPPLHIGIYEEEHQHPREALEQLQKVIDLTQSAADRMPAIRASAFTHMSFAYSELGDAANQEKYLALAVQLQRQ